MIVAGFYVEDAAKELLSKFFVAIYDQNGLLRKSLDSRDFASVNLDTLASTPLRAGVTAETNGLFYFFQHQRIVAISEWGEIANQYTLVPPAADLSPGDIEYADELLSVELIRVGTDHAVHSEILILYAATGERFD
jgi:hypothetical protein